MPSETCAYCATPRSDDSGWCLRCFTPYPTEPATQPEEVAVVPTQATAATTSEALHSAPIEYAYVVPSQTPAPDSRFSWDPNAAAPAIPVSGTHRGHSSIRLPRHVRIALASLGVAAIAAVGGFTWWALQEPNDKVRIAERFATGKPTLAVPDLNTSADLAVAADVPDTPEYAAVALQPLDATIRAANAALLDTRQALDKWADGKLRDRQVIAGNKQLIAAMDKVGDAVQMSGTEVPQTLSTALAKLGLASSGYDMSMTKLDDYIVSGSHRARLSFWIGVANANEQWDEALLSAYSAAGVAPPASPHHS